MLIQIKQKIKDSFSDADMLFAFLFLLCFIYDILTGTMMDIFVGGVIFFVWTWYAVNEKKCDINQNRPQ